MDYTILLTVICATCVSVAMGFTGGDDRFMKKYAMMKVYESCFGAEVVKEVRKEMKLATAKCNGMMPTSSSIYSYQPSNKHQTQAQIAAALHSSSPLRLGSIKPSSSDYYTQATAYNVAQQRPVAASPSIGESAAQHILQQAANSLTGSGNDQLKSGSIDLNKLQQVILSGITKQSQQQQQQQVQQHQPQQTLFNSALLSRPSYQTAASQIRPFVQQPLQQPIQQPLQYPQPLQSPNLLYQNPAPLANDLYQTPQAQSLFGPQPLQQYNNPFLYQNPFYSPYFSARASRDLDVKGQLETLTAKLTGKVKNVTCVMQELGYLDSNLEPDYVKMVERINRLPISDELKRDMAEGVEYCRQFSQCVPDSRKDKLAKEMLRPMFFFRCYKHKKLEACIMKDIRERYSTGNDDFLDENVLGGGGDMRSMKSRNQTLDDEHMEVAIYEFLYGGETAQLDSLL